MIDFTLKLETDSFVSSKYLPIFSKAEEKPRIDFVCFELLMIFKKREIFLLESLVTSN